MFKKEEFKNTWFIDKEWRCFACNNNHRDYYTTQRHVRTDKHRKNSKIMLKKILETDFDITL